MGNERERDFVGDGESVSCDYYSICTCQNASCLYFVSHPAQLKTRAISDQRDLILPYYWRECREFARIKIQNVFKTSWETKMKKK